MFDESLRKEDEFFDINRDAFVEKYRGKYIVIKNQAVSAVYDDYLDAYEKTIKNETLGTFLIQYCVLAEEEANLFSFASGGIRFVSGAYV